MAEVFVPGLACLDVAIISKTRLLPIDGDLLVKVGDKVKFNTVVAMSKIPGIVHSVNVVNALSITPNEIERYMVVKNGDTVTIGQFIAESKPLFGMSWFKTRIKSPVNGTIENISSITGQVLVREPPQDVKLNAYISGVIKEVYPKSGVLVEAQASFIQGIFGIGGENFGELSCLVENPGDSLPSGAINEKVRGKVVVVGKIVTKDHIQNAIKNGVKCLIAGGVYDLDIKEILGYEIGVAITGNENIPITVVITEGFGELAIAERTFKLLKQHSGKLCAINGTTQIRAGVQRPEIIIPLESVSQNVSAPEALKELKVGSAVRVIREPYFGKIGKVTQIIDEPQVIETGSKVRIIKLTFDGTTEVIVPRSNIELI
ncbi:MAG: hypothetical protein HY606_05725 [Planctomycetes bacterium]|nr:hypothetical protein [Planctomycetota bacterium]